MFKLYRTNLREKLDEALKAVVPIIGIVLLLCFTIAPLSPSVLILFLVGAVLLVAGMMFFTLGVELAMTPMGERVGSAMTNSRKIWLVFALSFLLGFIITMSEPDLQVLAQQVPSIPNMVLIVAVAGGVGVFLMIAAVRMLFGIPLAKLLLFFYAIVFVLAFFAPEDLLAVAFDSGGVTTGPITVPFIMAFGVGISSIRSDRHAEDDSFGLVALCSIGPIISVLILGMIYTPEGAYVVSEIADVADSVEVWGMFSHNIPHYMMEIASSILPIVVFFGVFQIVLLHIPRKQMLKIVIGLAYTYTGLVLFLTGVNVGFMPAGTCLGQVLASLEYRWIIIPIGMVIGYFIVRAEPAVYVLTKQVEETTSGSISARAMGNALSIGIAVSLGLAMTRVLTGISILWLLVPGYAIALGLSFFVPKIFTAIAFDSGGVASGPMAATFLLPFSIGACTAVGGNVITDAFGIVAMVAMTPLITIQIMGLVFQLQTRRKSADLPQEAVVWSIETDFDIIEL